MIDTLKQLARLFSENVFRGDKVDLHLCDDNWSTIRVLVAGEGLGTKVKFGESQVFYKPPVTETEARSLGDYLVTVKYFNDVPKNVQLTKAGNTYAFRFIAKEGLNHDQDFINKIRGFARLLSENVLRGDKVDLHLCDDNWSTVRVVVAL
jgi:hypothetical protein